MRVAVTGGAGFIGSYVCKLLLQENHQVTIIDNLSKSDKSQIIEGVDFIEADLLDQEKLEQILPGHDAVIHMASYIEVGESVKKPVEFVKNNVLGTAVLLEAMKNSNVKKIIFSSSACVYGKQDKMPITEDTPLERQDNPYGFTKVAMEQMCALYNTMYNFDVIVLRYFNPYGPGEQHNPETHAIPNFIKAILNKKPLPLYWKGEQIRDFIYIEDLASAHVLCLPLTGLQYFNVGSETGIKIIDIVEKLFDIVGYKVEIEDLGERKGDVPSLVASAEKIKDQLCWEAKTDFNEGLGKTVEFFSSLKD